MRAFALFIALLAFSGCGPTRSSLPTIQQQSTGNQNNNIQASSAATSTATSSTPSCAYMTGTIITPPAGMVGSVTTIQYGSHSYLMSPNSNQTSKNFVYAVPAGQTFGICFNGTFTTQTGIFPNPTSVFDVVVLTSISFL